MKMCRRYRGRHPVQKNQCSIGRGHGMVCAPRSRHNVETRDKPSFRVNPPQPYAKRPKSHHVSDDSSGLSGSESDDSSSESSKASSEAESKSTSDESSEVHSSSSSSSPSNESDRDSSNSNSKSKSQSSGLTESELFSDSDTSFSTSEEEEKNCEKIQRQMRRLEMNSNAESQVQIIDGSKDIKTTKKRNTKGPQQTVSSVESDPGFARYMSAFHERWKKHGSGPKGSCIHAHRSTIASSMKMAKRQSVGEKHDLACNHEPVNAASIFNNRQQVLYGDPGTFTCDHADKHDSAMMMRAIADDVESNKMIHDLIEKQVQKAKSGARRAKADLFKNSKF